MNRLGQETSPYLRQHKDNPVDWYPWGPEAMAAAAERDVPILLSVGYSACHWCHVMAHECFEDADVAEVMNRLYVCVKVDREERPDVDSVYMDAVQAMSGRGGWPMTVFMTAGGRPFFGGTYFPKDGFLRLMAAVDDAWRDRRADLIGQADQLTTAIARTSQVEPAEGLPGPEELNGALTQLAERFDPQFGGFGEAPKFPSTMSLDLVLRAYLATSNPDALTIVTRSLEGMAGGGIYDHLGGGFARYSVDAEWLVPHFEKMLYDQALLVRVYTHAFQVTNDERWRQVVEETITYVLRDLGQPEGGFSSAEDADSLDATGHSHEGIFYTWTVDEMRAVLGADADNAIAWYGATDGGNFEGRNILCRPIGASLARSTHIEAARAALFEARLPRPRPGLDDKVLAEWNGLMFGAIAEAGAALGRPDWIAAAERCAGFLCDNLRVNNRWRRSWQRDGGARHDALAADHAALAEAFIMLAAASGNARWIAEAQSVANDLLDHFWDADNGGVFTTANDGEQLITRQKDLMDNATPGANSMAANALYRLSALTGERRYHEHANRILQLVGNVIPQAPSAFSHMLAAIQIAHTGMYEVVIVGDRPDLVAAVHATWQPNAVLAWGERFDSPLWEGRTEGNAYVCENFTCQIPVTTAEELLTQLSV
jgi:uncharacterized protein